MKERLHELAGVASFNMQPCCGASQNPLLWANSHQHLLLSISNWTTRTACGSKGGEKWLSHLGFKKRTEREAPIGPRVNIKTDNCSYLHTITRRQHQTDLESRSRNKRLKKKKDCEWYLDLRPCFNENGNMCKGKQFIFTIYMDRGSSAKHKLFCSIFAF